MNSEIEPYAWNSDGFISPIDEDEPTSPNRSPYTTSLDDLVYDFGYTRDRRRLLTGLLDYRAELHRAGVTRGFQWINGSFLQNVESVQDRSPNDIDVATFFYIPDGYGDERTFYLQNQTLFDTDAIRSQYLIDAHYVFLNPEHMDYITRMAAYWYSVWSHTEDWVWKGYLQVDLAGAGDSDARQHLANLDAGGGPV